MFNIGHVVTIIFPQVISQPWPLQQELEQWETIQQITINNKAIVFECKQNITPVLVRFFIEKGYDILGVHQKDYGRKSRITSEAGALLY